TDPRPDRPDQRDGYGRASGGTERDHGAVGGLARLCARKRQGRARQAGRGPAGRRGHPRVLPWRAYGFVPRRQALPTPEAVALMTNVLEFQDVRLNFAGIKAIDGVSFEVGEKELFAIIGPNGAGKTSIFNVISGVYRPQAGRVTFDGTDLIGRRS